jgi:RNA polymerase sigma-70 factor (ECF subfamily)
MDSHGDRLLRSAYLLCGNRTEAQDLVQETYLQAMKSGDRFRGDSAVYTWLYGILLNLCRRDFRRQKRLVFEEERVLGAAFQTVPAGELDRGIASRSLELALQKLSLVHREVIVLRYYESMKIAAMASQLGISKGTVKSRLHYAVRCLVELIPSEMNLFATEDTHSKEP